MELKISKTEDKEEVLQKRDWFAISLILLIFVCGFIMLSIYWVVPHDLLILAVGLLVAVQLVLLIILAFFRGWTWALAASFLFLFHLYPAAVLIFLSFHPLIPSLVLIQAFALIILGQTLLSLTIWARASYFEDPHLAKGVGWMGTFFGTLALIILESLAILFL